MKKTVCLRLLAASLLVTGLVTILGTSLLLAQSSGTGGLAGTVTDPSGAVLPNVRVTATDIATGQARTATTGNDGNYRFSLLPPGNYKVEFSTTGFKEAEVPSVTINVTEIPVVNQKLQIGTQTEQVTVQAGAEEIQTATSTLGTLVGGQAIADLPLTSRNFTQILGLSAGTSAAVNNAAALGRGTNNISVNGNDTGSNNVQMDGVGINNYIHTDTNDDGFYASGIPIPSPDAIQEFMVQTSTYDASYGRNPGANINVVTKSGTNQLHGTAFEFFRNAALNSAEYFSQSKLLDQNQFGGVIGGPIKRDKAFFFGSYSGTRQKNGLNPTGHAEVDLPGLTDDRSAAGVATALDPSSGLEYCNEGLGISCNGTGIDAAALKILQLKGGPTGSYLLPSGSGPASYTNAARFNEDQVIGNVDYIFSAKNTLQARVLWSKDTILNEFPDLDGGSGALGDPLTFVYHNNNDVVRFTSLLTNTFTNEVRLSFQGLDGLASDQPVANSTPADLGITPAVPGVIYPPNIWIGIPGTTAALFAGFSPVTSPVNQYQIADQVAWSHGKHTIRAGFETEKIQHRFIFTGFVRGFIMFFGMDDFLQGNVEICGFCVLGGPDGVRHDYRVNDDSTYVQDDWKISQRLTINTGLRWEYFGFPWDKYGALTDFDPALANTVPTPTGPMLSGPGLVGYRVPDNYPTKTYGPVPAGVQQSSTNYSFGNPPRINFAPRIGFAWQPTNSQKLVVRGGFGLFYDRVSEDEIVHGVEQGPPYSATLSYNPGSGHTLDNPFAATFSLGQYPSRWLNMTCAPDGTECTGSYSALSAPTIPQKLHTPLVRQYNVNIQYEFAPTFVLQAAYVGSSGINLVNQYGDSNIAQLASPTNPINGQIANTIANIPLRVPLLGYGSGLVQPANFNGVSMYNSLQVTMTKQVSHGLQMQVAYTWSKAMTDLQEEPGGSAFELGAMMNNPSILRDSYAPSPQNIPQRFVVNYQYDLPFGHYTGVLGELANSWELSGVTVAQKGFPITLLDPAGGTIYGPATSTAQLCPGKSVKQMLSSGSLEQRVTNGYFNADSFCNEPTLGTGPGLAPALTPTDYGNSPVDGVYGPGQFNWDISLNKGIKITETKSLVFRTEFYNAFNHTQFANPDSTQTPSLTRLATGAIGPVQGILNSTAVNPRLIQFGLKFKF